MAEMTKNRSAARPLVNLQGGNNMAIVPSGAPNNAGMAADGVDTRNLARSEQQQPQKPLPPNIPEYLPGGEKPGDTTVQANNEAAISGQVMSPYFAQIRANEQKMEATRTMPVTDTDGRTRSGIAALKEDLRNPMYNQVKSWGELAAAVSHSAGAFIGGAIDKTSNERKKRVELLAQFEAENKRLAVEAKGEQSAIVGQQNVGLGQGRLDETKRNNQARIDNAQKQLEMRVNREAFLKLNAEQKAQYDKLMKRGYYYEGDNPEEDAKLRELGIVAPDFDNKHKPMVNNGVPLEWNPQTRQYEQSTGTEVDPDERPVTFQINGQNITASSKNYLNYMAGKEKQETAIKAAAYRQQTGIDAADKKLDKVTNAANDKQLLALKTSGERQVRLSARKAATDARNLEIRNAQTQMNNFQIESGDLPKSYTEEELQQIEEKAVEIWKQNKSDGPQ